MQPNSVISTKVFAPGSAARHNSRISSIGQSTLPCGRWSGNSLNDREKQWSRLSPRMTLQPLPSLSSVVNQRITTGSALYRPVTHFLSRLPFPLIVHELTVELGIRYGNLGLRPRCFLKPLFIDIFHWPSPTGQLRACGETDGAICADSLPISSLSPLDLTMRKSVAQKLAFGSGHPYAPFETSC